MAYQKFESDYAGQPLTVETGHIAEQANGALFIRCRDVVVLVTATANKAPREGIDFFPLTCDYEEKLYSVGRIPGSFPRREGRPSEAGVLASRMIDRPLRPLFPKDFRNDVQIIATVLSADQEQDPTTLAVTGASLALAISDIPHAGPSAACASGCSTASSCSTQPSSRSPSRSSTSWSPAPPTRSAWSRRVRARSPRT